MERLGPQQRRVEAHKSTLWCAFGLSRQHSQQHMIMEYIIFSHSKKCRRNFRATWWSCFFPENCCAPAAAGCNRLTSAYKAQQHSIGSRIAACSECPLGKNLMGVPSGQGFSSHAIVDPMFAFWATALWVQMAWVIVLLFLPKSLAIFGYCSS